MTWYPASSSASAQALPDESDTGRSEEKPPSSTATCFFFMPRHPVASRVVLSLVFAEHHGSHAVATAQPPRGANRGGRVKQTQITKPVPRRVEAAPASPHAFVGLRLSLEARITAAYLAGTSAANRRASPKSAVVRASESVDRTAFRQHVRLEQLPQKFLHLVARLEIADALDFPLQPDAGITSTRARTVSPRYSRS